MEGSKPRRKGKWLSNIFKREDSNQSTPVQDLPIGSTDDQHVSSQPQSQPRAQAPVILNTSKTSEPKIAENTQVLDSDRESIGPSSPILKCSREVVSTTSISHDEKLHEEGQTIPTAITSGKVLAAPKVPFSVTAKSTSPYQKEEYKEKIPSLLDPTNTMRSAGLWEKAYAQLSKDDKHKELLIKYEAILDEKTPETLPTSSFPKKMEESVKQQIDTMKQKQWVLQWNQRPLVIRDQAERVVKFVQTFSALGTAVAQIDPIHVGIPWAGVCAILTLVLNDTTQHQAALDSLEEVSSLIAKYIAIEDIYVQNHDLNAVSDLNTSFETAILKVYSEVLQFQVKAALHFHRPTMARTVSNIVKSNDWVGLLKTIKQYDSDCVAMTSVTGIANIDTGVHDINRKLVGMNQKLDDIHNMSKIFEKLQESWEKKYAENARVISWVSDAQVGEDHARVRAKLGASYFSAGQWFLETWEFQHWKKSQGGQLWLQGSVGTGKTSLASIVINELLRSGGESHSIAFYYCSRGLAAASNNPTAIFRSLVAQLACTSDGEEIYKIILDWYKRDAKRYVTGSRLSLTECEDLLIELMNLRGKTTLVIDGVDECTKPMELLRSLHRLCTSHSVLKIFIISRLDVEVLEIFPKISTVRSDFGKTSHDIKEYIRTELQRKERRNPKVITDQLAERMVDVLTERAQGMFRWVELQLDLLISSERRIKYRKDFENRLTKLELGSGQEVLESLRETYDDIYERNTRDGEYSRNVAEKALQWILSAARPLKIWELGVAVSVSTEDPITTDLLLELCSNFFLVDPRGLVQLAHLSVREYLETKEVEGRHIFIPEEAHAEAALTCLLYWRCLTQNDGFFMQSHTEAIDDVHKETEIAYSDMELRRQSLSEPTRKSRNREEPPRTSSWNVVIGTRENMDEPPTASMVSKAVIWGENETKHYEVESPSVHRDEYISASDISEPLERETKATGSKEWGAIVAGIVGTPGESGRSYMESGKEDETNIEAVQSSVETIDVANAGIETEAVVQTYSPWDYTQDAIQKDADRVYREIVMARKIASQIISSSESSGSEDKDTETGDQDHIEIVEPPDYSDSGKADRPHTSDYFSQVEHNIRMDEATYLTAGQAFKRFQRYASIYWATHCQRAGPLRLDESRRLNDIFWEFLEDNGSSPAFHLWAVSMLNETKISSVPLVEPAPMIFVPATAHQRTLLDAEPIYESWQEVVTHAEGPYPLMPSVPLLACYYGFTEILEAISDNGSAQMTQNHDGTTGLALAAAKGWNEALDFPYSKDLNFDIRDKHGATPLHYAALGGYLELARFLLGYPRKSGKRGIMKRGERLSNVNAQDMSQITPLHYAANAGQVDIVKLLLAETDLDVHAKNHFGYTALALCGSNLEVANLLRADKRYVKEDEFQ
ncbi:hypothetical protein B0J14DRAFT_99850 [Halenospora varia]|nr:hypothetical protein B0J14DRAFT_99850 [Halenospora varia]